MKTLNQLTPDEARNLRASMSLDFNSRVLSHRLHECINCNHAKFKLELSRLIDKWYEEIDDLSEKLIKHENETKDTTGKDA